MPVAIIDGILGIEARHVWQGVTTLNDIEKTPRLPRVRVDRVRGLHSLPEADDNRAPNTARMGETPYPSFARGKTVVYEGRLQAATLQDLRQLEYELRAAFSERSTEGTMVAVPHADYGTESWFYAARVLQLDIDDEQPFGYSRMPAPFERAFTLGLRQSDPRYYLSDAGSSGSIAGGVAHNVTNEGTAPTEPAFVINPNDETVIVENLSVLDPDGEPVRLEFDFSDIWVPGDLENLRIDFRARTAIVDYEILGVAQVDQNVMPYLTGVTWWDENVPGLAPGVNQLRVTGATTWQATFYSASW